MIDNFNKIKAYVLTLGGFTDTAKLDLQIEMIINESLAYCYREDVPENMELPLSDVIVNEINKSNFVISSLGYEGNITSYKEGDMQISLGSSGSTSTSGAKYDGKLEGFKLIAGVEKCSETTDVQ